MTRQDFTPRVRTLAGLLRDMIYIVVVLTPVLLMTLFGLYSWHKTWIVENVRSELGIDNLATQGAVEELTLQVARLVEDVRRANGEDKVIRQTPGLSYVEEPVLAGQPVILWLQAARTERGINCKLEDWVPLFRDTQNVLLAGSRAGPIRRQIGNRSEKLRVEIIPPPSLIAGRIELYLALEYTCDGERAPDKTDVVTYRLLEGEGE